MTSTITSKGQTTLPKQLRRALRLRAGARIEWREQEGGAAFTKLEPAKPAEPILVKPRIGKDGLPNLDHVGLDHGSIRRAIHAQRR